MAQIPGGDFWMGTTEAGPDELPRHEVYLDKFLLDRCEVTVKQYSSRMSGTKYKMTQQPKWSGPGHPVVGVDWFGADAYCRSVGKRLPTEAEWEWAARGGFYGDFGFKGGRKLLDDYAWYADNSADGAQPVGMKKPNAYGVYDMQGNAAEWVGDWYSAAYYAHAALKNPAGPESGIERAIRGGAWDYFAEFYFENLLVGSRMHNYPASRSASVGFRCAKDSDI